MIATSRPMQATAVMLAAGLHIAAFQNLSFSKDVQIAAAGAAQEVALGTAFADLAFGVMTAEPVNDIVEPVTPTAETAPSGATKTTPSEPMVTAMTPRSVRVVQTAKPSTASARPDQNVVIVAPVTLTAPATTIASAMPAQSTVTALATTEALSDVSTQTPTPQTTTTLQPVAIADAAPTPQAETLTGQDVASTAPFQSRRPTVRPERLAPPPQPRQAQPHQQTRQPRGNAQQIAQAGAQTPAPRQTAATSSGSNANAGQNAAASNAAISNYPGQVMQYVSRVRRPRTNARGVTIVAFSIVGSGGLRSLSIARSSGNAELDTMALQVVQRAAPFPPPPSGAQTRFRIEITGR